MAAVVHRPEMTRSELGDDGLDRHWAEGKALSRDAAIALAAGVLVDA